MHLVVAYLASWVLFQAGKLVAFLLTERGIKANLHKCDSLDEEPKQCEGSTKVDRLNGCPVTLFVSQW